MRARPDGLLEAETFDEHMRPDVIWIENSEFAAAFAAQTGDRPMDFGAALSALKQGQRVAREGWNGKGMFIYHVPAASYPAQRNERGTMLGIFPDDMVPYRAYIAMKTAQGDVVPWVASQSDLLEDDWVYVNG